MADVVEMGLQKKVPSSNQHTEKSALDTKVPTPKDSDDGMKEGRSTGLSRPLPVPTEDIVVFDCVKETTFMNRPEGKVNIKDRLVEVNEDSARIEETVVGIRPMDRRLVDAMGHPMDGKGPIESEDTPVAVHNPAFSSRMTLRTYGSLLKMIRHKRPRDTSTALKSGSPDNESSSSSSPPRKKK